MQEVIIRTPEELASCCAFLESCPRIGFDTEFVGEDSYHPRLCLVQVAVEDRLFLIDPFTAGPLDAFWPLLVDSQRLVVVHAGREEIRLCRLWGGQPPGNLFDLQVAAGLVGLPYPMGHGPLVNQMLGIRLSKGETLTEWRARPLTAAQIHYAFDDVRHLLGVWEKLDGLLKKLNRTEWAREEFARLVTTAIPEDTTAEKWRRLRGLGSLDRRRLALVRDLYAWREEFASQTNRPTRSIIRDDLIVEVARRNPIRERDLYPVRGLHRRNLKEIMEVIIATRKLTIEECPPAIEKDQDPPQVQLVSNILNAVLADLCSRNRLAPNLVTSNSEVKQLIRARMDGEALPPDLSLTNGWRARHILPDLVAFLEGKRSLCIANIRSAAPFAYHNFEDGPDDKVTR